MKIKTWIKYEEAFVPPRCRKPRYSEKEEFVDVELKEAAMSDLQLAFEDNSFEGRGKIFYYPKKRTLWTKALMRDVCTPGGEDEHGYHTPLEALIWWNEHGSKYFRFDVDRVHYDQDTSREYVLALACADIKKYLVVDGELYVKTTVPFYNITTFGLGNNDGGTGLFVDYGNIKQYGHFDALHGKEAVAYATGIAKMRGDTDSIPHFHEMIVVHMPELVKQKKISNL